MFFLLVWHLPFLRIYSIHVYSVRHVQLSRQARLPDMRCRKPAAASAKPPKKLRKLQAAMERHDAAASAIAGGSRDHRPRGPGPPLAPPSRSANPPLIPPSRGHSRDPTPQPPPSRSRSPDVAVSNRWVPGYPGPQQRHGHRHAIRTPNILHGCWEEFMGSSLDLLCSRCCWLR